MIRRLKIGLVCVMFLMTGCIGGGSTGTISNSGEVVQVTFWHYYSGDTKSQMDLIIEEFNKTIGLEKGIEVTGYASDSITQLENDVLESALGVVYASEMPDVFLSYEDKALELNELGAIIDFNEYLTPEELSVIEPAFLEEGQFNEIQGILPFVKSTELLMLNDTAWQEFASVSGRTYDDLLTWEGIEEVSQEYYEYTEGKSFFGIDSLENFVVVASKGFGVEIFQGESQETVLDDEALYKIFAYYVENYALSYVMQEAQFRSDDIRIGNIIAYVGSSASAMYFPTWIETEEGTQEISLKVLPYPAFEGTTPYALSQGAGLVISESNEEQEAAAVEFVKFLMERNISFALQTSYIPVASSYYELTMEEQENLLAQYGGMSENDKEIYRLVIAQMEDGLIYQPDAFIGSYDVRIELSETFQQIADASLASITPGARRYTSEEVLIESLSIAQQYEYVITAIRQSLENKNIICR